MFHAPSSPSARILRIYARWKFRSGGVFSFVSFRDSSKRWHQLTKTIYTLSNMKLFESNNCKIFILFFLFIPNKLSNLSQLRIHVLQRYKTIFFIHFIDLYFLISTFVPVNSWIPSQISRNEWINVNVSERNQCLLHRKSGRNERRRRMRATQVGIIRGEINLQGSEGKLRIGEHGAKIFGGLLSRCGPMINKSNSHARQTGVIVICCDCTRYATCPRWYRTANKVTGEGWLVGRGREWFCIEGREIRKLKCA